MSTPQCMFVSSMCNLRALLLSMLLQLDTVQNMPLQLFATKSGHIPTVSSDLLKDKATYVVLKFLANDVVRLAYYNSRHSSINTSSCHGTNTEHSFII